MTPEKPGVPREHVIWRSFRVVLAIAADLLHFAIYATVAAAKIMEFCTSSRSGSVSGEVLAGLGRAIRIGRLSRQEEY